MNKFSDLQIARESYIHAKVRDKSSKVMQVSIKCKNISFINKTNNSALQNLKEIMARMRPLIIRDLHCITK